MPRCGGVILRLGPAPRPRPPPPRTTPDDMPLGGKRMRGRAFKATRLAAAIGAVTAGLLLTTTASGVPTLRSAPATGGPLSARSLTATFIESNHVSFTLSACRLPDANHDGIPDYTL